MRTRRSRIPFRGTAVATAAAIALFGTIVPTTAAQAALEVDPLIHYTFDQAPVAPPSPTRAATATTAFCARPAPRSATAR